jgi:hypothetical protein
VGRRQGALGQFPLLEVMLRLPRPSPICFRVSAPSSGGSPGKTNRIAGANYDQDGLIYKRPNAPEEFSRMSLSADDVDALSAFLLSLTEDYDDT